MRRLPPRANRLRLIVTLLAFLLAGAAAGAQKVTMDYTLAHPKWIASNQVAVWIEDAGGAYVKTVFATDFMARRKGYKRRPQCCPEWVKASGLAGLSDAQIDAFSGATQKVGAVSLAWDCTDANGKAVAPGTYVYKVEGSISFDRRVVWTGRIRVGDRPDSSRAEAAYLPAEAKNDATMLADVRAAFTPR